MAGRIPAAGGGRLTLARSAWPGVEAGGLIPPWRDYPMFRVDHMPYGGVKDSGFGREGVRYAVQEYTEPRLMAVRGEA